MNVNCGLGSKKVGGPRLEMGSSQGCKCERCDWIVSSCFAVFGLTVLCTLSTWNICWFPMIPPSLSEVGVSENRVPPLPIMYEFSKCMINWNLSFWVFPYYRKSPGYVLVWSLVAARARQDARTLTIEESWIERDGWQTLKGVRQQSKDLKEYSEICF